jgi:hypothetical protein
LGVAEGRSDSPLCIVSGGTISGYPSPGELATFKVLNFPDDRGPRRSVEILEVPLRQDAAPEAVISGESRRYQITLASPRAELNDFNRLNDRLDEVVVNRLCAAELQGRERMGWDVTLFGGDPELLSPRAEYQLNRIIETKDRTLLVDVILATSRLRFQESARIYWLLSDAKRRFRSEESAAMERPPTKVLLLIGNLEDTPLAQTTVPEEVGNSIANLREWFAPAISAERLEVRTYHFTEEEVFAIIGTKPMTERPQSDSHPDDRADG